MTMFCTGMFAIISFCGIAAVLFPGIAFILFSSAKQQKAYRECMRRYRNLKAEVESGCKHREIAESFWRKSAVLFRRIKKNKGMRARMTDASLFTLVSERITAETPKQHPTEEKIRVLKEARKELEMIDDAYTPRGRRLNVYCYVCFAIFGLVVKTLLAIAFFAAIAAAAFGACLLLGAVLLKVSGCCGMPRVVEWFDGQSQLAVTTKAGCVGWGVLVLLIGSMLLVFLIYMQKVTKMLIILINVLFDGAKLTAHVVLAEKINTQQLLKDIAAISQGVKRKNSSGFFNNFFRDTSEFS